MSFPTLFPIPALQGLFDTLLPDLLLSFTFFTALAYVVFGKQFGRTRAAAAMAASIGLALSVGLVSWEDRNGYSIRDMGLPALVFAVLVVSAMVYQAVRRRGGAWAGAGLAIAVGVAAAWLLGAGAVANPQVLATFLALALIVGLLSVLIHAHAHAPSATVVPMPPATAPQAAPETSQVQEDLADLKRDQNVATGVWGRLRRLRRDADLLRQHPGDASSVLGQLKRLLPAEGWLTERLARLRARAYLIREGHVARITELRELIKGLPAETKRRASQELSARYHELKLDTRLGRLDKAVAENERRIRDLTRQAEQATVAYDYRRLTDLLAEAEKLQGHNSKLLRTIDHTEQKLAALTRETSQIIARWRREASSPIRVEVRRADAQDGSEEVKADEKSAEVCHGVGEMLLRRLGNLRRSAALLPEGRADPSMIMAQLQRSMPEEGWLTERLSQLRARIHRLRRDHEARLADARRWNRDLTGPPRRQAAQTARMEKDFVDIDRRLERLDSAVAEAEKRIVELTRGAMQALAHGDEARLMRFLRIAQGLQRHSNRLLDAIARTEEKLARYTAATAKRSGGGDLS